MPRRGSLDLQALYLEQRDGLLTFLARRTADPEIALDLLAETFAQAVASRKRFRPGGRDQGTKWLYGIAKHQLALYYRRGHCEQRAMARLGVRREPPSEEILAEISAQAQLDDLRGVMRDALAQLSDGTRSAVELRVVQELAYSDIARRLCISEGAARVRVSRGLAQLGELLDGNASVRAAST
jgi:RNA polymerase sigma-70 factor (ECF subfamily)